MPMSSTCDRGRSRLLPGVISLLLLLVALAIAAGAAAPAADATKELTKCNTGNTPETIKVKKISCKDATKKVVGPFIKSWFLGTPGIAWRKGCDKLFTPGNVCSYGIGGFQCYGKARNQYVLASDCTHWIQREKKNQRVVWVLDRRVHG